MSAFWRARSDQSGSIRLEIEGHCKPKLMRVVGKAPKGPLTIFQPFLTRTSEASHARAAHRGIVEITWGTRACHSAAFKLKHRG